MGSDKRFGTEGVIIYLLSASSSHGAATTAAVKNIVGAACTFYDSSIELNRVVSPRGQCIGIPNSNDIGTISYRSYNSRGSVRHGFK